VAAARVVAARVVAARERAVAAKGWVGAARAAAGCGSEGEVCTEG
jgi:hypothetical protein